MLRLNQIEIDFKGPGTGRRACRGVIDKPVFLRMVLKAMFGPSIIFIVWV